MPVPAVGMISLLDLNDCFSHVKLLSFPCSVVNGGRAAIRTRPTTCWPCAWPSLTGVSLANCGSIATRVYFDNTSKSPFPTRLHLFLLGLGIALVVGPPHQPRKRAITERSHQTWDQQVLAGSQFTDWEGALAGLTHSARLHEPVLALSELRRPATLGGLPASRVGPATLCTRSGGRPV